MGLEKHSKTTAKSLGHMSLSQSLLEVAGSGARSRGVGSGNKSGVYEPVMCPRVISA